MNKRPHIPASMTHYLNVCDSIAVISPELYKIAVDPGSAFRGLTVFHGDNGLLVAGLRIWNLDGAPEVMWSSGTDLPNALINLNSACLKGKWRPDKPR